MLPYICFGAAAKLRARGAESFFPAAKHGGSTWLLWVPFEAQTRWGQHPKFQKSWRFAARHYKQLVRQHAFGVVGTELAERHFSVLLEMRGRRTEARPSRILTTFQQRGIVIQEQKLEIKINQSSDYVA